MCLRGNKKGHGGKGFSLLPTYWNFQLVIQFDGS